MLSLMIMRHGPAECGSGCSDEDRQLTPEGAHLVKQVARGLKSLNVAADLIVASPFSRTRQTAAIIHEGLQATTPVAVCDALASGADPHRMVELLRDKSAPDQRIIVVGHMPDVSALAAFLLSGQAGAGFSFGPGAIAQIDFYRSVKPGAGMLRWFMQPEMLAVLA